MSGQTPFQSNRGPAGIGWHTVDAAVAGGANGDSNNPPPTAEPTISPSAPDLPRPRTRETHSCLRPGHLVVSQHVLGQYRWLFDAEKRRKELRKSIVELLEAGAVVEHGPLNASLRQFEQRPFSAEQMVRLFGRTEVERLRRLVQPVVSVHLIVEPVS
jgi:hypothetical protein